MPFSLYVDLGRDHHDSYSVLSLLLLPSGAQVLEDCCSQHACWASIIPPRTYCKAPYACCPGPYFFSFPFHHDAISLTLNTCIPAVLPSMYRDA